MKFSEGYSVRLRTLTHKSIIGFGKHTDMSVYQMLCIKNYRYLRWIYFNSSKISFIDEILDEINLLPEFRIKKPGKDPEKVSELNDLIESKMSKYWNDNLEKKNIKGLNSRVRKSRGRDRISYSKSKMQARNHGRTTK